MQSFPNAGMTPDTRSSGVPSIVVAALPTTSISPRSAIGMVEGDLVFSSIALSAIAAVSAISAAAALFVIHM
jgi:hypothetical protein